MKTKLFLALILMGFTSLLVQSLLIREFLISFYGNELIVGLILANWIILEAAGSLGSNRPALKIKQPILIYATLQMGIALYLPVSIFIIRTVKNILGLTPGEGVGIIMISLSSFFILAPLSFLDGAQFPFGCKILSDYSKKPIESTGKVYILEAMGFIFAGPIFTFLLIKNFNSFQIAFFIGIFNLLSGALLLQHAKDNTPKRVILAIIAISLASVAFVLLPYSEKIHSFSISRQWKGQKILDYRNSVYGNLVVSKSREQYTFYSDGIPVIITPTPDVASIEELVHFSCLSHKDPKNILILSGGTGGVIEEILKYPVERIDYAELDPLIINLIKKFPSKLTERELNDPRLNIHYIDGRRFAYLTNNSYDLVLLNLPAPYTLHLNRFFTQEFFKRLKQILRPDGIFAFRIPGSLSYIDLDLRNLNGSLINTLRSEFNQLNIIPGDFNLYLASMSDFKITPEILSARLRTRAIKTKLISPSYLSYRLDKNRLNWFMKSLGDTSSIRKNLDLTPSAVFYSIAYWNALFSKNLNSFYRYLSKLNFNIIILALGLIAIIIFIFQRTLFKSKKLSIGFAITTTGFMGMSVNLIIIFSYQSFYGYVFHHLALLITAFMAGLSLGGWLMTRNLSKLKSEPKEFLKIEILITCLCLLLIPMLLYLNQFPATYLAFILFIATCLSGFLTGAEFPLANKIYWQNTTGAAHPAGTLYALDLIGAWGANLIVCVALVPIIGIINTCLLLVALKAFSIIFITTSLTNHKFLNR